MGYVPMTPEFLQAMIKQVKAAGYVVVPNERVLKLTASQVIDDHVYNSLKDDGRWRDYQRTYLGGQFGHAIAEKGTWALTETREGSFPFAAQRVTAEIRVILPKDAT